MLGVVDAGLCREPPDRLAEVHRLRGLRGTVAGMRRPPVNVRGLAGDTNRNAAEFRSSELVVLRTCGETGDRSNSFASSWSQLYIDSLASAPEARAPHEPVQSDRESAGPCPPLPRLRF
jgi:hypothetical protein